MHAVGSGCMNEDPFVGRERLPHACLLTWVYSEFGYPIFNGEEINFQWKLIKYITKFFGPSPYL